jgi:hypothetical protein
MAPADETSYVADLLRRREELYHGLFAEADKLLTVVGSPAEAELGLASDRRQELLESIQKIDAEIAARCDRPGNAPSPNVCKLLKEFADRRKVLTGRILEKDSLVIALANGRIEEIKLELGGLSKGRTALHAYDSGAMNLAG